MKLYCKRFFFQLRSVALPCLPTLTLSAERFLVTCLSILKLGNDNNNNKDIVITLFDSCTANNASLFSHMQIVCFLMRRLKYDFEELLAIRIGLYRNSHILI